MDANSQQQALYDFLRLYRNAIFTNFDTYYANAELYQLVDSPPLTKADFLRILPSEEKFEQYGNNFLELIRMFKLADQETSSQDQSPIAKARQKLETLEVTLHKKILKYLKHKFPENDDWWYQGVPKRVRLRASETHEESDGVIPKENCLYLIDIKEIIVEHWGYFQNEFGDPKHPGKPSFERKFNQLNNIRNLLSHPIRLRTEPITPEDLGFLDSWLEKIGE